uniref:Prefoldin subunit 3 n=1 Tax=Acrobeloides nanus TaxID=290746 RepID=A0A914EST1_9BILA
MASVDERMEKKGVPKAAVIENVEEFLNANKLALNEAQKKVEENFRKYKYIEASVSAQQEKILLNLPDYKNSLNIIKALSDEKDKGKESIDVSYKLAENIYSKAVVDNIDEVCLWLGASVMVAYDLEEAKQVLEKNIADIEKWNNDLNEELDFIKDQITTTEVNIAHIYNYGVLQKQKEGASSSK